MDPVLTHENKQASMAAISGARKKTFSQKGLDKPKKR